MLAAKYEKALLGEADPQADDPDPMEGFRAQYLNIWPLSTAAATRGNPIVDKAAWAELQALGVFDPATADAAAIESWFDAGAAVAFAWRLADGAAAVSVLDVPDLTAAAAAIQAAGYRGRVPAGSSLLADPALRGIPTTTGQGRVITAVTDLSRLLAEGQFAHDGSELLTRQVLAVRTVTGTDGPRLASHGRADAIKAAVWAATTARAKPVRRGRPRVITAAA